MSKGILIGKLIYATLQSSNDVVAKVGTRVFPIVAPNDTDFPFVVYTRTNTYPQNGTKDGWDGDVVSFEINIATSTYNEGAELADKIRDLFENCRISTTDLAIENIRMTSCSEAFNEDTYVQSLFFECESN